MAVLQNVNASMKILLKGKASNLNFGHTEDAGNRHTRQDDFVGAVNVILTLFPEISRAVVGWCLAL